MKHTIKNTHGKFICEDDHIGKIKHMLEMGYKSTVIDGNTVSIILDGVENVKNRAERVTVVEVAVC